MTQIAAPPPSMSGFEGIYDVPETARYLKAAAHAEQLYPVRSGTLIRWIRRGLASPGLSDVHGRELLIDFEDVISLRVIAALRAVGVSWRDIYRSGEWLRSETGVIRPFATDWLWTGQGEVFAEWSERLVSTSSPRADGAGATARVPDSRSRADLQCGDPRRNIVGAAQRRGPATGRPVRLSVREGHADSDPHDRGDDRSGRFGDVGGIGVRSGA